VQANKTMLEGAMNLEHVRAELSFVSLARKL
jgi:hypothetical protein